MASNSATVLVVDDEAVVRRVLGDALIQAGYKVRLAANGAEAFAALEDNPIDLVFLDLQLGNEDGIDIMRTARERWAQIPIIILTAHGSMNSAIEALRHDAADYLLKPLGLDTLRARAAEVIKQSRANQQRQERIQQMYQHIQALIQDEGLAVAAPTPEPNTIIRTGPLRLNLQQHLVYMADQMVELTPTEFAILHTLVRQPGAVVPCVQLIRSFQQTNMEEDEARTVMRPHIVRLRRKIESDPQRPVYILSVRGIGYRWNISGDAVDDDG